MLPPIPPMFDGNLISAVSALTRAAHSYRSVLFLVASAIGREAIEKMMEHEDLLNLSDSVINAWRAQLAHDTEDDDRLAGNSSIFIPP